MKYFYLKYLFVFFIITSNAQVGGESVYQFLNLPSSARQLSLGGEVLTLIDDINQPIWNPAAINNNLDQNISFNYSNYLSDINLGSLSYAHQISRRFGTIHGSISYLDYGKLTRSDLQGNELGFFRANDISLAIGYAVNLPWTNFYFGSNIKFINSSIDSFTSYAFAMDLGINYYSSFKDFSFSLVLRNFGTQLKNFNGINEQLPFKVALGGSYKLKYVPLQWHLTLDNLQQWNLSSPNPSEQITDLEGNTIVQDINFITNALRHIIIGAELFPESVINLRMGYNFRRAAELKLQEVRTFGGISFGFGVRMNRITFNYAYSKFHTASNSSTFSLQIDLDKNK
jgi:hypothetical protein